MPKTHPYGRVSLRRLGAVVAALLLSLTVFAIPASAQIQGYGVGVTGGAAGSVCTVTTSAGSGTGSFSSCLSQSNRNIQFAVASTTLSADTYIRSNTTIDGCANGQNGVTIDQTASSNRALIIEGPTSNVLVRCMRFQGSGNNTEEFDLLSLDGTGGQISRVAIERSTFVGAPDGALDITGDVSDVTVQKSLFYGSVLTSLIKYDTRMRVSIHHNVYTGGAERNPQIKGDATAFDFVSNVVHQNTAASYGYGTRLHNGNSSSDSPGNVQINMVANAFMGTNGQIEILTDSGASASGIYIASNNYCSPASNCPGSPASSPQFSVPAANQVTVTLPGCMASAMLPTVGAPNRTSADTTRINAVASALPTNCTGGSTPTLSISDVSVAEGNSGTTTATFTATLSAAATGTVTVNYATANGTATAGSDYVAASGTLTFPAGTTSRPVTVTVNGDTTVEPSETFTVNLSAPTGATLADAQGVGTITSDDSLPQLSINDVSLTEGNTGTKAAAFTVTLSPASASTVSVTYATANQTATAGSDYVAAGGSVTFPAGSTSQTLSVTVNGDTTVEPNETFLVNLSGASGATILDAQGVGTLTNDDGATVPTVSINDASVSEGNSGTKTLTFTPTLSAAASSTVTVGFATGNGSATAGSDYVAQSGTLSFTAGQTTRTLAVVINGDTTVEANETFVVNLSSPNGATLADSQGVGTVMNDDSAPPAGAQPVVWTSLVGVTANGSSLTKTGFTGSNAGAASTQQISSGDGYVETTAAETTRNRVFGLSNGNSGATNQDIDFALGLAEGARVYVFEKGVLRGSFGTYRSGDVFRVAVVGGVVRYSKNGTVFYTSTQTRTYPLLVDTYLYTQSATLNGVVISGVN